MKTYNHFYIIILVSVLIFSCTEKNKPDAKTKEKKQTEEFNLTAEDESLLNLIQRQTFNYFWEGAEPNSGLARERIHMDNVYPTSPKNTVTTGGSGFGLMAILVGVERNFITREDAFNRYVKIVNFLEKADRFHGAWPHWINGETGKVLAFSKKDNGGDLVETAFLVQGLLTVAEYFREGNESEKQLVAKIEQLCNEVEWDWYTKGENVLYWHWSPEYDWQMNFPVKGYNEALIMYVLAAGSPKHSITPEVYHKGWARNGNITKDTVFYGLETELDHYPDGRTPVGPLFWAHYSYTGLNPKGLKDSYGDYWKLNRNHAMIHYKYAVDNPKNYKGYGENFWGFTSSYSPEGYAGHNPSNDLGVISPTAALSSFPYTPKESMKMLRHLYKDMPEYIGKYGPYDAVALDSDWKTERYLAIDQGPIPVMIENYRTGLLWNLFMKNKEVQNGLKKLGFTSPYLE
ncbi:beta-glucosidase [Aureibaculum marinum]|uniref:Beta-glucosidase n=1 Tax=Aureibaculum marinum TaxID=2487930 RepID=A0A3N4N398_9FLAO|nr:glucoamylase family protein [Aureibaculum marinum]RPD90692.1 beta-glucosidase [Aureibaculum marinum]